MYVFEFWVEFLLFDFFPELETSTGFEYFTKDWGWLKFEGWEDVIMQLKYWYQLIIITFKYPSIFIICK